MIEENNVDNTPETEEELVEEQDFVQQDSSPGDEEELVEEQEDAQQEPEEDAVPRPIFRAFSPYSRIMQRNRMLELQFRSRDFARYKQGIQETEGIDTDMMSFSLTKGFSDLMQTPIYEKFIENINFNKPILDEITTQPVFNNYASYRAFQAESADLFDKGSSPIERKVALNRLMTQFNQAPKFDFFETDDGLSSTESPYPFDGDMGRAPLIQYFDKSFSPTYVSSGLVKPLVQSYNVPFEETGAVPGTYFSSDSDASIGPLLYQLGSDVYVPSKYLFDKKYQRKNTRDVQRITNNIGSSGVNIFNEAARLQAISGGQMGYSVSEDVSPHANWIDEGNGLFSLSSVDFKNLDDESKAKIIGSIQTSSMTMDGPSSQSLLQNSEEAAALEELMKDDDAVIVYDQRNGQITFASSKERIDATPLGVGQVNAIKEGVARDISFQGMSQQEIKQLEGVADQMDNYLRLASLFAIDGEELSNSMKYIQEENLNLLSPSDAYGFLDNELDIAKKFDIINEITSPDLTPTQKAEVLLSRAGVGFTSPFTTEIQAYLREAGYNPGEVDNMSSKELFDNFKKEVSGKDWVKIMSDMREGTPIVNLIDEYIPFLTEKRRKRNILADATIDLNEELLGMVFVMDYYARVLESVSSVDIGDVYTLEDGTPMIDQYGNTMSPEKLDIMFAISNSLAEDQRYINRVKYTPSIINDILENKDAAEIFKESVFTSTLYFSKMAFAEESRGTGKQTAKDYKEFLKREYPDMDKSTLRDYVKAYRNNPFPDVQPRGGAPGNLERIIPMTLNMFANPLLKTYQYFAFDEDEARGIEMRSQMGLANNVFYVNAAPPANIKFEKQGDYVSLNGSPLAISTFDGTVRPTFTMTRREEGETGYMSTVQSVMEGTTSSVLAFMSGARAVGTLLSGVSALSPGASQIIQLGLPSFVMSFNDLNRDEPFFQQAISKAIYATGLGFANRYLPSIERLSIGKSFGVGPLGAAGFELIEEKGIEPLLLDIGRGVVGLEYESNLEQSIASFQTIEGNIENAGIMLTGGLMHRATDGINEVDLTSNRALVTMFANNPYMSSALIKEYAKKGIIDINQAVKLLGANRNVFSSVSKLYGVELSNDALGQFVVLDAKRNLLNENTPEGYEKDLEQVNSEISELLDLNKKHQEATKDNDYVINGEVVSKEKMFEYLEGGKKFGDLVYISDKDTELTAILSDQEYKLSVLGQSIIEMGNPERYAELVTDLDNKTTATIDRLAGIELQIDLATSSLASEFPEIKFKIHENQGSFVAATGMRARGAFDPEYNVIHINAARADKTTVGHEVFEAIIYNSMNTDQAFKVDMVTLANDIMNNVDADTRAQLESFVSQYEAGDISREAVSQFFGIVSANTNIEEVKTKSANFFNVLASRFGLATEINTDEDAISVVESMAKNIATGEPVGQVVTMEGEPSIAMAAQLDEDFGAQQNRDAANDSREKINFLEKGQIREDGSRVYKEEPPQGVDYEVESGILGTRKRYVVSQSQYESAKSNFEQSLESSEYLAKLKEKYISEGAGALDAGQISEIVESLVNQNNPQSAEQIYQENIGQISSEESANLVDIINKGYEAMGSSQRVSLKATTEEGTPVAEEGVSVIDEKSQQRIDNLNKSRANAKSNIKRGKMGADPEITGMMTQLFNIDPLNISDKEAQLIPGEKIQYQNKDATVVSQDADGVALRLGDGTEINVQRQDISYSFLDRYTQLAEMMSARALELPLSEREAMMRQAESIFNNMNEAEALPSESITEEMSEEEKAEMANSSRESVFGIVETYNSPEGGDIILDRIPNKDSRRIADELFAITEEDFDQLDLKDKVLLSDVMKNINNGFVSNNAFRLSQQINVSRNSKDLLDKVSTSLGVGETILNLGSIIRGNVVRRISRGGKSQFNQMLRLNPKIAVDRLLGNFNDRSIYDNTFGKLDGAYEGYQFDLSSAESRLKEASNLIDDAVKLRLGRRADSGKTIRRRTAAQTMESRYLIKALELQREYDSNPSMQGNTVFSAAEWIDARLKDRTISRQERSALRNVRNKISVFDGVSFEEGLSAMQERNNISENEIKAFEIISEVNAGLAPMAMTASSLYRGESAESYSNYTRHKVEGEGEDTPEKFVARFGDRALSTRGGTTYGRTKGLSSINFDAITTAYDAASNTLVDYYMTPAIGEVNNTVSRALEEIENKYGDDDKGLANDVQYKKLLGLQETIKQTENRVLRTQVKEGSNEVANIIFSANVAQRLANFTRPFAEFISNLSMLGLKTPKSGSQGVTVLSQNKLLSDGRLAKVLSNLGSTQIQRLTGATDIALATGGEAAGPGSLRIKGRGREFFEAAIGIPSKAADVVMSTPDMAVGLPVWFGSFDSKFESITGKSPDYNAIISGNERYLRQNKNALSRATKFADRRSIAQSATKTAFSGIEAFKGDFRTGESSVVRRANGFMRNFARFEFETQVQGIQALINDGEMSKSEAVGAIAGSAARYFTYSASMGFLKDIFSNIFSDDDEEESLDNAFLMDDGLSYRFEKYEDIPKDLRELATIESGAAGYYVDREVAESWEENQGDVLLEQGMRGLGQYAFQFVTGGGGGVSSQLFNAGMNLAFGEEVLARAFGTLDENEVYEGYENSVLYSKFSKLVQDIEEGKSVNLAREALNIVAPIADPLFSRTEDFFELLVKRQRLFNDIDDPESTLTEEEIAEKQEEIAQLESDLKKQGGLTLLNVMFSGPIANTIIDSELDEISDRFYESEVRPPNEEDEKIYERQMPTASKPRIRETFSVKGVDGVEDIMNFNSGRNSEYSIMDEIITYETRPEVWERTYNPSKKHRNDRESVYGRYTNNTPLTKEQIFDYIINNSDAPEVVEYFQQLKD